MKRFVGALALISILIGVSGCVDSRKEFEPKTTFSASNAITKTGKKAREVMRDGITFSDGSFLTKSGMGNFKMPDGFHYVNQSSKYVLGADNRGNIKIFNRSSGKVVLSDKLKLPLVSGAIYGNKIFYIQQDNQFGIYNISQKKNLVNVKVGRAFAVDTRITNPILVGGLLIVPTLDGKLLVINPNSPNGARGMAIGDSYNLNNVIYLSKMGNRIVAATPKKLITAAPNSMHKFEAGIADVAISGGYIYALTKDGRIVKLTPTLKVVAQKRFDYAQFTAIAVVGNKVFALDRNGALVVTDKSLKRYKIYDVGSVDNYAFVASSRLYIDDKVVNLTKLGL